MAPRSAGWTRPFRRDRRGGSAAEFALIASVISVMFFGIVDVGKAAFQYITLHQSLGSAGEFIINHANRYGDLSTVISASLPSNWTDVTVGTPRFFCQSSGYSCANPPPSSGTTVSTSPFSAATCSSTTTPGQGVYMTVSRPNTTILLQGMGSSISVCYVGRFQ